MISTSGIKLQYGERVLFKDVNIKFASGNCYGLIGANGSGKSTFLKILSGELTPTAGTIEITPGERLAVLKQDHFEYDDSEVLKTVIMGHDRLWSIMSKKEELYAKADFNDADGAILGELETEFAELNGWEAESDAGILLSGLGVKTEHHTKLLKELEDDVKIKVLLAQALFGKPEILLLDEPTNHLDIHAINWLEHFLLNFENTVIVVSHDRHFLNKVCTHMADIDFSKIQMYVGNYDFWFESSQLANRLRNAQNKKAEDKAKELKAFIQRFSANASKAKQATSRRKQLEKLTLDDIPPSSRKYPYVEFKPEREAGKNLLRVEGISKTIDGTKVLDAASFTVNTGDKIVFLGDNEITKTTLFQIIMGEIEPDEGEFEWGITTSRSYFPKDNSSFLDTVDLTLVDWMRQFSKDQTETFVRGFLGKMLFSGEEALKKTKVLSGGEKARCMYSRMMLSEANVLILDGPTNHLDLESITAVNNALIRFPGTILFTSHDHQFIHTVANRIIDFQDGGMVDKVTNYDEYLALED
jgi:ATPase subunit of ABC transporter with duplicated ATPase domains